MQKQLYQVERELKIRNYSGKTIKSYLYGLNEYFAFKKYDFESLDTENIKDFLLFAEKKKMILFLKAKEAGNSQRELHKKYLKIL